MVLAFCAASQPAQASCLVPGPAIAPGAARLASNPDWCGQNYGCYGVAPVSNNLDGFFWGQTAASGARFAGADSGGLLIGSWTQSREPYVGDGGTYYYTVYLAEPEWGTNWSWDWPDVDGCIDDITPATRHDECTCLLLTDSWNGQGYMAILSVKPDAMGNFYFFGRGNPYTPVVFGAVPGPVVTNSAHDPSTRDVTVTVDVPTPLGRAGDYRSPPCDCAMGYRVYAQVVSAGSALSDDRTACTQETLFRATGQSVAPNDPGFLPSCRAAGFDWLPALDPSGAPQSFKLFDEQGAAASVRVPCGEPGTAHDIYLAVSLGTNEGPGQIQFTNVSQASLRVRCGDEQLPAAIRSRNPETPGRSGPGRFLREIRER